MNIEQTDRHFNSSDSQTSLARASAAHRPTLVVFIEDAVMRLVCCESATQMGFRAEHASSISEAKEWIETGLVDIAIIQIPFCGELVLEFVSEIHHLKPDIALVTIGTASAVSNVVEAVHRGASDYLAIPFTMEELSRVLTNAADRCCTRIEQLRRDLVDHHPSAERRFTFKSRSMEALVRILPRVAQSAYPVLIAGESGTGKERVARAIHEISSDMKDPFIVVDCSSPDSTLLEAELFGEHTGMSRCSRCKKGRLTASEGGVVYLDEVGNLPLPLQGKLIQAIRDKEVVPRGCGRANPLTVRIIAASSFDLPAMVSSGTFRKDLFYRLNIVCLRIPPLRERREDIPLLIATFLHNNRGPGCGDHPFSLGNDFLRAIVAYNWPGNVRELESVVTRACALAQHSQLRLCDLPTLIREQTENRPAAAVQTLTTIIPLREVEHQAILNALTVCAGDRREAARRLGIGKSTLYRKLIEFGHTSDLSSLR